MRRESLDLIWFTKLKASYFEQKKFQCWLETVSPLKKVLRFGLKGKLSLRFIGFFKVIEKIGHVAYGLKLPHELDRIHDVFHISMLRKYHANPSHVVLADDIEVQPNLTYEEEPVKIMAHEVKILQRKKIHLVKVLW
ncbi:Chromo domain-containing protein [Gossypium australe]|uniref:Chromo domain-containing protein n=1 Tax=Gossypium australe TaxID=47621 RepID=A0A5B6WG92_9ROSI|nr:Chromo domain-containing protein [Gossypium australe]